MNLPRVEETAERGLGIQQVRDEEEESEVGVWKRDIYQLERIWWWVCPGGLFNPLQCIMMAMRSIDHHAPMRPIHCPKCHREALD